jgi:hypothetical protein
VVSRERADRVIYVRGEGCARMRARQADEADTRRPFFWEAVVGGEVVQGEAAVCCLAPCLCRSSAPNGSQAQVARQEAGGECQASDWALVYFWLHFDARHNLTHLPSSQPRRLQ